MNLTMTDRDITLEYVEIYHFFLLLKFFLFFLRLVYLKNG